MNAPATPRRTSDGHPQPRRLGPIARRLAEQQPEPEPWKPAWLRRLPARDETGRAL